MNRRPRYPPPAPRQQNDQDNQLSRDISNDAEILIIVIGIIGIWKYIVVSCWAGYLPGRFSWRWSSFPCPTSASDQFLGSITLGNSSPLIFLHEEHQITSSTNGT